MYLTGLAVLQREQFTPGVRIVSDLEPLNAMGTANGALDKATARVLDAEP